MPRSLDFLLEGLERLQAEAPNQYLAVPFEVRQLAEARARSQLGAEVESRNRMVRNREALGTAVSFLSSPDADPDEVRWLREMQAAKLAEDNQKAMAERVDLYGTPYSYEARARAASGGIYRDDAGVKHLLRTDPAALLTELRAQQPAPTPEASGGSGGTFSVLATGRPRDEDRADRLRELLGLAETATARRSEQDATRAAKLPPGEKERRFYEAEAKALAAARTQGVDTIIAAIREDATRDPETASIAGKLIASLKNKRLLPKDLERAELGEGDRIDPESGTPLGEWLPADRSQAERLRALRDQRAAERGFY